MRRLVDIAPYDQDDDGEEEPVSQRELAEIIEARLEETLELVHEQLYRAGYGDELGTENGALPGGVVLVGGTAQIPGIRKLAQRVFGASVRIGTPSGIFGAAEAVNSPSFATSVGLLRWGITQIDEFGGPGSDNPIARLRDWLRGFFP